MRRARGVEALTAPADDRTKGRPLRKRQERPGHARRLARHRSIRRRRHQPRVFGERARPVPRLRRLHLPQPPLDLGRGKLDVGRGGFITERTFGSTPLQVANRGSAFARGLTSGGVIATGKHFPGLGYAETNTDNAPTIIRATRAQLLGDLLPYGRTIDEGLKIVLVGNVWMRMRPMIGMAVIETAVAKKRRNASSEPPAGESVKSQPARA